MQGLSPYPYRHLLVYRRPQHDFHEQGIYNIFLKIRNYF
jgi:hypothetical protein